LTTDRTTMSKQGVPSMRACRPSGYQDWSANGIRTHVLATAFGGARRPEELPT
jgi:hypothetical protein